VPLEKSSLTRLTAAMISINRLLACLVALVIAAAVVRGGALWQYYRTVDSQVNPSGDRVDLRESLLLAPDHTITRLIAVPGESVHGTSDPPSWKLAWISTDGDAGGALSARVRGTAILRGAAEELVAVDITSLLPDSNVAAVAKLTPQWLGELHLAALASLPSRPLGRRDVGIGVWDPAASVYVTAGPDGAPGIAGIDDDGDGVVDDPGELGATGSDDFVVAPGQLGYEAAKSGQTLSRLISRGAIVAASPDQPLDLTEATEIWLDFDRDDPARHRQIMLRLR